MDRRDGVERRRATERVVRRWPLRARTRAALPPIALTLLAALGIVAALFPTHSDAAARRALVDTPANSIANMIREGAADSGGARARARNQTIREVSALSIAQTVLNDNLEILTATEARVAAQARITQRLAAFDPTIFTTSSYTHADTRGRFDYIGRLRNVDPFNEAQETTDADGNVLDTDTQSGVCSITIDGEGTVTLEGNTATDGTTSSCFGAAIYSEALEFASGGGRANQTQVNSVGAAMRFPYGGQVNLGVTTTWRKKFAFSAPALTTQLGAHDPFGWGEEGRFWTSAANITFTSPLPYTKGFGLDGDANWYGVRLSRAAMERSQLVLRSTRNSTLTQALSRYWDMVQAAETVRLVARGRGNLTARLAAQKRLYDSGLNTQYDVLQIEVELANLTAREELTWDQFLSASQRLRTVMNAPRGEILVPVEMGSLLSSTATPKLDPGIHDRAIARHPDVRLSDLDYQTSRTNVRFRHNQALPNITFTATATIGQNDSAFGYTDPFKSLGALVRPDSANLFFGLRYTFPFGNVAPEAALNRARQEERQAFDRQMKSRQTVASAVDQAITSLLSAQNQMERAAVDVELARTSYQRAVDMRDQWLVSEFEVLNRFNDTLNAEMTWAMARVAALRAQTQLLSAQGILEQEMSQ